MPDVKPTRSELINLKKKIKLAQMGHGLLKRKKDGLVQEFFKMLDEVKDQRKLLSAGYKISKKKVEVGRAMEGTNVLESAAFSLKTKSDISLSVKNVMGVGVPKIHLTMEKKELLERGYGIIGTDAYVDEIIDSWEDLLEKIVKSAETETSLKRMLIEIEKTKRRVSALEYVVIPNMESSAAFIRMRLEEMERENLFRLKRIKKKAEVRALQ